MGTGRGCLPGKTYDICNIRLCIYYDDAAIPHPQGDTMLKGLLVSASLLLASTGTALAEEALKVSKVVDNVYAIVGPIDDRTYMRTTV